MDEPIRSLEPGASGSGSVNTVTRQGDTVRRPAGPWTPAVHGLLQHVRSLPFVPRVLGLEGDEEVLTYLEGEVALRPWPRPLLTLDGLEAVARMIMAYHDAVADYVPPPEAIWRVPGARHQPGQILRHGDLGPWNMVWRGGTLTGLIDWDFAEPGSRLQDIAQLAWYCVPLHGPAKTAQAGIELARQRPRFLRLCQVWGVSPDSVLEALVALQELEIERMLHIDAQPWRWFAARGDIEETRADQAWLGSWW